MTKGSPLKNGSKKDNVEMPVRIAVITGVVTIITAVITSIAGPAILKALDRTPVPTVVTNVTQVISLATPASSTTISSGMIALTPSATIQILSPTSTRFKIQAPTSSSIQSPLSPTPPPIGFGTLSFKMFDGCVTRFNLYNGDISKGSGMTSDKSLVAAGKYELVLLKLFGELISTKTGTGWEDAGIREQIEIRERQETVADLTQKLGILQLAGYPDFEGSIRFEVIKRGEDYNTGSWGYTGIQYCISPGYYSIDFSRSSDLLAGNFAFYVEVKAGNTTFIKPENWPIFPGLLRFKSKTQETLPNFAFAIYEQATGKQIGISTYLGREHYWLLTGTYKIVLTETYLGYTINNVEIEPGKETVVELP